MTLLHVLNCKSIQKISGWVNRIVGKVGIVKKVKKVRVSKLKGKRYDDCYEF